MTYIHQLAAEQGLEMYCFSSQFNIHFTTMAHFLIWDKRALILKLENMKLCDRCYPLKSYNLNNSLNMIRNLNSIEKMW